MRAMEHSMQRHLEELLKEVSIIVSKHASRYVTKLGKLLGNEPQLVKLSTCRIA